MRCAAHLMLLQLVTHPLKSISIHSIIITNVSCGYSKLTTATELIYILTIVWEITTIQGQTRARAD